MSIKFIMKKNFYKFYLFLLLFFGLFFVNSVGVMAVGFTKASMRYDRMKAGMTTAVQVVIVPRTTQTESKIRLVFGGATPSSTPTINTSNIGSATALPGTLAITKVGTTAFEITGLTDLTVGTTYAFNVVDVTNPVAGQYKDSVTTLTGAGAEIDSTVVASRIIADDQVVITANIPPTFTFSLSTNADAFSGDLDPSVVRATVGIGVSTSTNAAKGWIGWIKSSNNALSSVTTGESIATSGTVDGSPSTCTAGTDCYVVDANITTTGAGTGALTIDPEYNGSVANSGGALSSVFVPFVSRSGKTDGDKITLIAYAAIIAGKSAGSDYTDTWTVVGAGNF